MNRKGFIAIHEDDDLMRQLLERSTWHPTQHARQLMAVLEGFGIQPDGPLTANDLAGLPPSQCFRLPGRHGGG